MPKQLNGMLVSTRDLIQRYQQSYFVISVDGVNHVIFCSTISDNTLSYTSPKDARIHLDKFEIVKEFPEMGAVNIQGDVHYVLQNPKRQFSRGLTFNRIFDICRNPDAHRLDTGIRYGDAVSLFYRHWVDYQTGHCDIQKNIRHSFAMSNNLWVSGNKKHEYLWFRMACVAEIIQNKLFLFPNCKLLEEEVLESLEKLNAPLYY